MERAPLPPHERTWRHPSEVGPTAPGPGASADSRHGLGGVLATGTLAIIVVAALVVSVTPRRTNGPVALSATTVPAVAQTIASAVSTITTKDLQAGVVALANSVRTTRIDEFTAIPRAIASVPGGGAAADSTLTDVAADQLATNGVVLPDLTDEVMVITEDFTYPVPWRDVPQLTAVHDAVVVTDDGTIVAMITDGRLVVASDSHTGQRSADPEPADPVGVTASAVAERRLNSAD